MLYATIIVKKNGQVVDKRETPWREATHWPLIAAELLRERYCWVPADQNIPQDQIDEIAIVCDPDMNTVCEVKAKNRWPLI